MFSIDRKFKICFGCEKERYIWKNNQGHKYCIDCWNKIKVTESKKPLTSVAFKLIDFSKTTPKKSYKIRPISDNRKEALKKYKRLRDKFLLENNICQFPGCTCKEVTLHHMAGRQGSFLTDKRWFKALCWPHHNYVEEHPDEAISLGLSKKRLDKYE